MAAFPKEAVFCRQRAQLARALALHGMASPELDGKLATGTDAKRPCFLFHNGSEGNQTAGETRILGWTCLLCPHPPVFSAPHSLLHQGLKEEIGAGSARVFYFIFWWANQSLFSRNLEFSLSLIDLFFF